MGLFTNFLKKRASDNYVEVETLRFADGYVDYPILASSPTSPNANYLRFFNKTGSVWLKDENGVESQVKTIVGGNKGFFIPADVNTNRNNYRVRSVSSNGAVNFSFALPTDLTTIQSIKIIGIPRAGAALAGRDIDLTVSFAKVGELINLNQSSDTTSTYDFSGKAESFIELDVTTLFVGATSSDLCGIKLKHHSVGSTVYYLGIVVEYT